MHVELDLGTSLFLATSLARLKRFEPGFLKGFLVNPQTPLFGHDLCKVDREPIGVVQSPDVLARENSALLSNGSGGVLIEKSFTSGERARERGFLLIEDLDELGNLLSNFREDGALNNMRA